ncbi:MAG: hydrogenase maturation protease [Bryobacterales bacterium]|nr:hydrogenase maturation protease [Bryobacteraceae bacterium]MDW8130543.1 hydrogenase maturation protease [Bryobacterales bacterium]
MLVIGVGHPDCGDDAAGCLVARRLRELGLRAIELSGEATTLMNAWEGEQEVIVVDATLTGATPGTIQIWDAAAAPLRRESLRCSTHGMGVAEAVELARALGRLPAHFRIYGIEGRKFEPGQTPSPEVTAAIEEAARRILEESGKCTSQD